MRTLIHIFVGYFFLLLTVRVLSRRPGGQLTPFEFVIVFLIGGTIIAATMGRDLSMTNSVCAVLMVSFLHRLVSRVKQRWPGLGRWLDGMPLVLLADGRWQTETLRKARVDETDVMAVARGNGYRSLDDVKYAILERNGSISLIRRDR